MFRLFAAFSPKDTIIAEGPRVDLRTLVPRDFRIIHRWFQDNELMAFAFGLTVEDRVLKKIAMEYFDDLVNFSNNAHAIVTKGGLLIGFVRFSLRKERFPYAKIGIMLGDRNYWGGGYGTEALTMSISELFEKKNLHRIELDTAQFNERAQRCFEKCGFQKTGETTEVNFLTGEVSHKVLMRLTREEFMQAEQLSLQKLGSLRSQLE